MTIKEQFIEWLQDAYAMERALVDTLKKHSADAEDYPQIQKPIDAHRKTTEDHADQVEALLDQLGADKSGLKAAIARFTGMVGGLPTSFVSKNIVTLLLKKPLKNGASVAVVFTSNLGRWPAGFFDAASLDSGRANEEKGSHE